MGAAYPTSFDEFEVVGPLGQGGMGTVFVGHDRLLDRPVALKFITSDDDHAARARFVDEARAIARLHHPNVVGVYRISEVEGRLYIAYELVDGAPLSRLPRPAPWRRVLDVGLGLARGLAAVHASGVVHRDIKPSNVMIGPGGTVKLIDFGVASRVELGDRSGDWRSAASPRAITFAGTPAYAAPELWLGAAPSRRSDVYALGLVMWELLAGALPHADVAEPDLASTILSRALPPIASVCPGVPPPLSALVDRCVAYARENRVGSAAEVRDRLEAIRAVYAPLVGNPDDDEVIESKGADRLAGSLERAIARHDDFAARFYARLFADAPALRALFPDDLTALYQKLLATLLVTVRSARSPATLVSMLEDLGARHAGYGARIEDFDPVVRALLATLAHCDAEAWTPALAHLWKRACDRIAGHMARGLARAQRGSGPIAVPRRTTPPVIEPSLPKYARAGDAVIAYQLVGEGARDLVVMPGWLSHLELNWQDAGFADLIGQLAQRARVVLYDTRGTGLSDRVTVGLDVDHQVADLVAVLDAARVERAVLLAIGNSGPTAALLAATHPERVRALVFFGATPAPVTQPDFPGGLSPERIDEHLDAVRERWGEPLFLDRLAPSRLGDAAFVAWWARMLRSGVSPSTMAALLESAAAIDVRGALPVIRAPTLVLHRRGDQAVAIAHGRAIADAVPGARFVELDGDDHLVFSGDRAAVVRHIDGFLDELPTAVGEALRLVAVMAFRSDDPAATARLRHAIAVERGIEVDAAAGTAAIFSSPAAGLRALRHADAERGAAAIHVEVVAAAASDLHALAAAWALAAAAADGEIWLSAAARALLGDVVRDASGRPDAPRPDVVAVALRAPGR